MKETKNILFWELQIKRRLMSHFAEDSIWNKARLDVVV